MSAILWILNRDGKSLCPVENRQARNYNCIRIRSSCRHRKYNRAEMRMPGIETEAPVTFIWGDNLGNEGAPDSRGVPYHPTYTLPLCNRKMHGIYRALNYVLPFTCQGPTLSFGLLEDGERAPRPIQRPSLPQYLGEEPLPDPVPAPSLEVCSTCSGVKRCGRAYYLLDKINVGCCVTR